MQASILTVDDELTCGYRLGVNSQTIARRLTFLHVTANDIPETIQRGLRATLDAANVVVTGGHCRARGRHRYLFPPGDAPPDARPPRRVCREIAATQIDGCSGARPGSRASTDRRSLLDQHTRGGRSALYGLIEHTNYIGRERYGGDHIIYCGDYLPAGHPYFEYRKEELLETYLPDLVKINPDFDLDWIRASWMFTEKYAQPVPTLNHWRNIPPPQNAHSRPLDGEHEPGLSLGAREELCSGDGTAGGAGGGR